MEPILWWPESVQQSQRRDSVKSTLTTAIRSAIDLLFPLRCVHCGTDGDLFCSSCESASPRLTIQETCRTCALPSAPSVCESCFANPPALSRAIALFTYDDQMRDAVAALKYKDIRALAPRLGDILADGLPAPVVNPIDAVVPVPLGRSRLLSRGYNQAELLARQISKQTAIAHRPDLLHRTHENGTQARSMTIDERADNVRDAFQSATDVAGMNVLLVDDVMTTGATLNACARALKSAGASSVAALVLAREL